MALLSPWGALAHQVVAGSLKQADFLLFVSEQVVPHLSLGDVVVVDNARCHQGRAVKEAIESAGATLLFLPPYSPDFASIELVWRPMKAHLRQTEARTKPDLQAAVAEAMQSVIEEQARSYFQHFRKALSRPP